MKRVSIGESFDDFRAAARGLLAAGAAPNEVVFEGQGESQLGLLDTASSASTQATALVPKTFIELAHVVALHRSPTRWPLLYEALFRITHGEHQLLADPTNALTLTLGRMKRSVTQDVHDMHAFVRFRRVEKEGLEHYIAWYEPEHRCLRLGAPHFQRRFAAMRWSILTPDESASWDLERLCYGPGVTRDAAPSDDELESLWKSYYASVFNPARLNVEAMTRQLPRRHWHNLPEAVLIPGMIKAAPRQTKSMLTGKAPSPSLALVPETTSLKKVSSAAHGCSICPWAKRSTQTVFGEGPPRTTVMMMELGLSFGIFRLWMALTIKRRLQRRLRTLRRSYRRHHLRLLLLLRLLQQTLHRQHCSRR